MTGDELIARYSGKRIKGIYQSDRHDEGQLYTEKLFKDGRTDYKGGDFTSTGNWYVSGDKLCFEYDEIAGSQYCFYEYYYGDCVISYSDESFFYKGLPYFPSHWNSVVRVTHDNFSWDRQKDTTEGFVCQSLLG